MENKFSFAAVGVFVVGFFIVLVTLVVWLTVGTQQVTYLPYKVVTSESVAGLSVNSAVDYKGVDVGVVRKIQLNDKDPRFVIISLDIIEGTPIKKDTEAVLTSKGVTGLVNVSLRGGTETSPNLVPTKEDPVPEIVSGASLIQRLDSAFNNITKALSDLSKKLDIIITVENGHRINNILANLETITHNLVASSEDVSKITKNASNIMIEMEPKIERALAAFDSFSVITKNVEQTSEGLQKTLNKADATLDSWKSTALVFQDLGQSFRTQIPNLNSTFTELNTILYQTSQLINQLMNDPNMLLIGKGKPKLGPGE